MKPRHLFSNPCPLLMMGWGWAMSCSGTMDGLLAGYYRWWPSLFLKWQRIHSPGLIPIHPLADFEHSPYILPVFLPSQDVFTTPICFFRCDSFWSMQNYLQLIVFRLERKTWYDIIKSGFLFWSRSSKRNIALRLSNVLQKMLISFICGS